MLTFESTEELLEATKGIVGKTFGQLDKMRLFEKPSMRNDKGILGKIVETGYYGYPNNSKAEADFNNIGVELKASGFIRRQNDTWSAKERISLGQINYHKLVEEEFDFSSVVRKNRKILFIWYEYIKGVSSKDFVIHAYQLFDFTEVETIIKNDYYTIQDKVKQGFAHLLSEGDSVILGAATKGASSADTASQPCSDIPAKRRAFSLKNSFIKGVLNKYQESLVLKPTIELSLEQWVWNRVKPYEKMTQLEILKKIDGKDYPVSKTLGGMITKRIFGNPEKLSQEHEIFNMTNYIIKSIPVDSKLYPLEKGTFSSLSPKDFEENWEDSEWKTFFEEVTIIYITYIGKNIDGTKRPNGFRTLGSIYKVTFTSEDILAFGKTYTLIQEALQSKDISKLPIATNYRNTPLVLSTKSNKGGAYHRFIDGERSTCFMFNKDFIYKKLLEAQQTQQFK
ncbi:MutH/Sau3AI family endonuclease [Planococcus sp. N028]|uniref:MutH/Sau3AI family endonuclease n=1 Tax=Planococcus shixiaomingii TaxID=3058393 RepID=A0ABT8N2V4_9BACL|nr:MutH/Sau3AI family endonuclease [Planococcus sp. N028]MDN7242223.1 MutH/Sau3AI family endonuclease [Planococcus sp. N028]